MTGIYIHVPFCERKCPYCAFYSMVCSESAVSGYLASLKRSLSDVEDGVKADTLYFGGGTPLLIGAENISDLVKLCRDRFDLSNAEITVECNPNSTDPDMLKTLRECGVNRLSVGVQSLDDDELKFLGRLHNSSRARDTIINARRSGFSNISADIMIGIRGQTRQSVDNTVKELSYLGAEHISVYMIKVEHGTAFDNDKIREHLLDDDELAGLYLDTVEVCESYGFKQYEISNFAKNGLVSLHNTKYWIGEDYLGFGPSAHSYYKSVRYCCPDDLSLYINKGQTRTVTDNSPDRAEEYIMLGFRLNEGISLEKALSLGLPGNKIKRIQLLSKQLEKSGLCVCIGDNIRLTPSGMLVSNSIISEFLL